MENIDIIDFDNLQKKKKKAPAKPAAEKEQAPVVRSEVTNVETNVEKPAETVTLNEFKDPYQYDFLLDRINDMIKSNNSSLGDKPAKFIMKPPTVAKVPGKRSAWINFVDNCNSLKRPPEHVCLFFLTELGTEGSIAGEQLILKGKYMAKHIESLIKKYITEYVCCQSCKSANTEMTRDSNTRLYMMKCNACQSTRSVISIKAGFQAVKQGDRKKEKNK